MRPFSRKSICGVKTKILLATLVACSSFGFAPSASAQIAVNAVTRTMLPNQRPIENVDVSNFSENRILQTNIIAEQSLINDDGTERVIPTTDFLVAPTSMILRPGEMKKARLVLRKPPSDKEERYYRVTFKAAIPDPLRLQQMGLDQTEVDAQNALSANISMISGMGIFVTVAPKEINPKLTWTRDAKAIHFKNEGNTSIEMRLRKEYCFDGKKNDCISLPYQRIYPGKSWSYEIGDDKPIVYYYKVYDRTEKAIIGAVK